MTQKKDDKPDTNSDDYPEYEESMDDEDYVNEFDEFDEAMLYQAMLSDHDDFDMNAYWNEPDFLLADIVNMMVNVAELEIGVTLFVKGMTLTGTLTSERQYLRDLTHTFRSRIKIKTSKNKASKEDQATVDDMFDFTHLSESRIAQELDDDNAGVPDHFPTVRFLHLKNPLVVGQNGIIDFGQGPAPYIRLRLSLVDGWMLGEVATPEMFDNNSSGDILH